MLGLTEFAIVVFVIGLVVIVPRIRQVPEILFDETALANRELEQLRSEHRVLPCETPVVAEVLSAFAQHARLRVPRLRALVLDQSGLNAAALPDGTVVLWAGLVDALKSDRLPRDELAGVIAHELAHIELGHGRQRAARDLMVRPLVGLFGLFGGGLLARLIGTRGFELLRKGASRQAELEADAMAVSLLRRAGFPTRSLARFLERLAEHRPQRTIWGAWRSTHPHVEDRLRALAELEHVAARKG